VAVLRLVGTVNAIAIGRAGPRIRQIAMPDLIRVFRQLDSLQLVAAFEINPSQVAPSG
jgi:hypothetical protein